MSFKIKINNNLLDKNSLIYLKGVSNKDLNRFKSSDRLLRKKISSVINVSVVWNLKNLF